MQSIQDIAKNIKPNNNILEEEHGLKCSKCGNTYDYYKFKNGQEFRHGCDCLMIEAGQKAEKKRKQKYLNNIFKQSNVNRSIKNATVNSYKPQNKQQELAKTSAIEFVKTFSLDNAKNLIFQGPYGTGKVILLTRLLKL